VSQFRILCNAPVIPAVLIVAEILSLALLTRTGVFSHEVFWQAENSNKAGAILA
jgi:hypothetical protein